MDSERASCSARWWSRIASVVVMAVVVWLVGRWLEKRAEVVAEEEEACGGGFEEDELMVDGVASGWRGRRVWVVVVVVVVAAGCGAVEAGVEVEGCSG